MFASGELAGEPGRGRWGVNLIDSFITSIKKFFKISRKDFTGLLSDLELKNNVI